MARDRQCLHELAVLLAQLPVEMADALRAQGPEFAEEIARDYLAADSETQAEMASFFAEEGPRRVHESMLKMDQAIPTAADLSRW